MDDEKGVPEVIEAYIGTDSQLVMAGGRGDVDGAVVRKIEEAENIEWRGFVEESEKHDLLARCRAVVFNGKNEDFGIVPLEANASGKPVLARNAGFPGIFVEEGVNGVLHAGTKGGIRAALEKFEPS